MFLSSLQPSAAFAISHDHGMAVEKAAIETELSYLDGFDSSNLTVDTAEDAIILEGVVSSGSEHARVLRIAHEIAGFERVRSRIIVLKS